LFLNNNYHLVHHDLPQVPWFALQAVYRTSRQTYIERPGFFLVKGYGEWIRRYELETVAQACGLRADQPLTTRAK